MEVIKRSSQLELHLVTPISLLVKSYIIYMDGIVEDLLATVRKRQNGLQYRSVVFNMYLPMEFFVGQHEHYVAAQWRGIHLEVVLKCQDVFELGSIPPFI